MYLWVFRAFAIHIHFEKNINVRVVCSSCCVAGVSSKMMRSRCFPMHFESAPLGGGGVGEVLLHAKS